MATQLQQAKKGIITPEMIKVSEQEGLTPEYILENVKNGKIVIPKNINHNFVPRGIGYGLTTKINANIGTSEKHCNPDEEIEKLKVAIEYGADAVMDLSTGGNLRQIMRKMISDSGVMIGTVPVYGIATRFFKEKKNLSDITKEDLLEEIETQAKDGVDFMTLHCGITQKSLSFLFNDERLTGIVSRGGAIMKKWVTDNNKENPLYEYYDEILDICEKYDVTLSLGDGLRPGSGNDATDRGQLAELLVLGELVDRARNRGVQVMVEGPGHVPLDQIIMNMQIMKKVCHDAPFYVLGPLTTDSAPGYDHIVGAIGGAIAASYGADFLCYVTPAEHLCLPDIDDVREGVIASRIAAHSADVVKGIKTAKERDYKISKARRELNWNAIYENALFPETAKRRRRQSESNEEDVCSMCGNLCAVKTDRNLP